LAAAAGADISRPVAVIPRKTGSSSVEGVGASGGVAAVIGACVVLQPRAQVTIHLWPLRLQASMRGFFLLALALQGLMGVLQVPGVAWTAHLLGLACGATGAALLRLRDAKRVSVRS
jgi:membrane associated rhomboid family serine protease